MSNTIIQIKRSTATAVPPNGTLAVGVPAYSYSSNTLFIGGTDGTGVIAIGGKYYIDTITAAFIHANQAFNAANTAAAAGAAYAFLHANAAFDQANSASATANAGIATANASYAFANSVGITSNLAFTHANNAYAKANAALPSTGGTVSGDIIITGNITVSGCTTYSNTNTLLIGDNIFVLNADLPSSASPSEDAGFIVNRGNQSNVAITWLEGTDQWTMTQNTGIVHILVANTELEAANAIAVGAFASANAGQATGNAAFASANAGQATANAAFATSNAAFAKANTANITADLAFTHANNAYTKANTANITADLAFLRSNQAFALANSATAQAANADFLTSGTVASARIAGSYTGITGVGTLTTGYWNASPVQVTFGGTGQTTFTVNGILYGDGSNPLKVTSAGTEGQVLQASDTGVPNFGMLDGGTF